MKIKYTGKIIGGILGLALGGPLWGAFGLIIGHSHDSRRDIEARFWRDKQKTDEPFAGTAQQAAFTMGVIVLGAKMAKADGRVNREEVEAFKRVFRVPESQVASVGRLFDQARRSPDGYEPYARNLAQMFRGRPAVLEEVLGGLFIIAASDGGDLSAAELDYLKRVAGIFEIKAEDFTRIAARAGVKLAGMPGAPRDPSYVILGIREEASVEDIKTAYYALIRKHHPDKLVAQGMAPEFIATATEKMKRINGAYDTICKARGIK